MQLRKRSSDVKYTENGSPTKLRPPRSNSAPMEVSDYSVSEGEEDDGVCDDTEEESSGLGDSDQDFQRSRKRPLSTSKRKHSSSKVSEKEKLPTNTLLMYAKPNVCNTADNTSSQSSHEEEEEDGDFVLSSAKSKKRKILAEPRGRLLRSRRQEAVNYKDASSSDELDNAAGGERLGRPSRKNLAGETHLSSPRQSADSEEVPESSKSSLRKKVGSNEKLRLSNGSTDTPDTDGAGDALKCYTRRLKNKFVVSDDEDDQRAGIASSGKGLSRKCRETHLDANLTDRQVKKSTMAGRHLSRSTKDSNDSLEDSEEVHNQAVASEQRNEKPPPKSSFYAVDAYGLLVGENDYGPIRKRIGKVEKVLAVRNRSSGPPIFVVKLHGCSYRNVVNVLESQLLKQCPQLLRTFLKRMDVLQRADGHPGENANSPAFNPRYLKIDRIVTVEKHNRSNHYYVKWCALPYSECTWEKEDELIDDKDAIKRFYFFNRKNKRTRPSSSSKLVFKDGRSLRDYQEEGVSWLDNKYQNRVNCILADEMGLGKTIQSVAMLETLRLKHNIDGPFLVVAPVSTLGHWQREVETLTDMNCVVYTGTQEDREIIREHEFKYDGDSKSLDMKFNVLLTSFEMLMKDQTKLAKIKWQFIIVDEAHRLKSRESKTTLSLKQMGVRRGGLLLLTGTPVQNNTKEIFSLLNILDSESFESEEEFLAKYGDLKNAEQVKDLQENVLRPRLLRRMKEDVEKSIPQKEETIVWVELTRDQRVYYRAIYENSIGVLLKGSDGKNLPSLRNVAMELRKVCNHPLLCDGVEEDLISKHSASKSLPDTGGRDPQLALLQQSSGKMVLVDKLLPMLKDAGRRVLIFSQFTMMLDLLEDYLVLKGYTYERIDGKIRGSDRQAAIDRYSAKESDIFVFLLSTRAGGLGITLTAADTCLIYDSDWNPQNDLQAMARCHRFILSDIVLPSPIPTQIMMIGQTKDVKIYRLITRNTYEQKLFECSSRKYGLDEAILGNRVGADGDLEQNINIESLLKHGAYDMLKDDGEADAAEFSLQNIHQILEQRTQKRLIGGRGVNTFSVATFISHPEAEPEPMDVTQQQLEKGTKEFWHELLPEACRASETIVDKGPATPVGSRRKRAQVRVDYREDHKCASDDDIYVSGGSGRGSQTDESSVSVDSDEDDSIGSWTAREVKRLEDRLMVLGEHRASQIQREAQLQHRDLSQIEQVSDAIIQLCCFFEVNKSISGSAKSPDAHSKDQKPEEVDKSIEVGEVVTGTRESEAEEVPVTLPLGCILVNDYETGVNYRKEGSVLIGDNRRPTPPIFVRKAMKSRVFTDRLAKNASRYLQVLREREILSNAIAKNDPMYLPPKVPIRSKKIPTWWGPQEDLDLMIGVHIHGHREFKKIRMDPLLCFSRRMSATGPFSQQVMNEKEHLGEFGMNVLSDPNSLLHETAQSGDWPPESVLTARLKKLIQLLPNASGLRENLKRNPKSDRKRVTDVSGNAEKRESVATQVDIKVSQKAVEKAQVDIKVSQKAVEKAEVQTEDTQYRSQTTTAANLWNNATSDHVGQHAEISSATLVLPDCDKRKEVNFENNIQQRITGYFVPKTVVAA